MIICWWFFSLDVISWHSFLRYIYQLSLNATAVTLVYYDRLAVFDHKQGSIYIPKLMFGRPIWVDYFWIHSQINQGIWTYKKKESWPNIYSHKNWKICKINFSCLRSISFLCFVKKKLTAMKCFIFKLIFKYLK